MNKSPAALANIAANLLAQQQTGDFGDGQFAGKFDHSPTSPDASKFASRAEELAGAVASPAPAAPASAVTAAPATPAPVATAKLPAKSLAHRPLKDILARLKLANLSDLALLMPKKFSDFSLKDEPRVGERQAAELLVHSIRQKGPRLIAQCFCERWQIVVMLVFFYPKAAEKRALVIGRKVRVYGRLGVYGGLAQFSGAQIIADDAVLEVDFRIRGVTSDEIFAIKQRFITPEQLRQDGLPEHIARVLLAMNAPSPAAAALFGSVELDFALKFAEIFYYLKRLHELAAASPRRKIIAPAPLDEWLRTLPFRPTQHQLDAIADVRADLAKSRHKERVVMGDVGCGKSLVMFAAALSVRPHRSVLMAPTSVLAAQLAAEARRLLPADFRVYHLQSAAKTGLSKAAKKQVAEDIAAADLIVSTHAALHNDLGEIALVMIDEQQRFGAKQRAALAALIGAHYLEFSATPIPRTTAMINGGFYNYSFIRQLPFTKQISTILLPAARGGEVMERIRAENAAGHQAIVVYPLIEQGKNAQYLPLNDAIAYYERNFSGVYVTHGKDAQKEATLAEFAERGNVLLSTTVIEVGISLPRLTVMVIVAPERYGLATLHQLRGRLGRAGLPGWCYLLSKNDFAPRLEEFAATMDGFKIAEIDLANRHSGDISADAQQHGEQFTHFDPACDEGVYQKAREHLIATFGEFAL